MFPRHKRLPRPLFPTTLKEGSRVSSAHFTTIFSEKPNGYAVVVPKKVARLSVTRNRIRRRTLEALRTLLMAKQPFPSTLILFPKASILHLNSSELTTELITLLSKTPPYRATGK